MQTNLQGQKILGCLKDGFPRKKNYENLLGNLRVDEIVHYPNYLMC